MLFINFNQNYVKNLNWVITEYFKSPFILWGIVLFVITILADYSIPAKQFLILLWAYNFHWVFFIPTYALATIMAYNPYRSGIIFLIRNKQKIYSTITLATIFIALITEGVSYYTGIISLIGYTFKETIISLENFEQLVLYSWTVGFFGIPISFIYVKWNIRHKFSKENLSYDVIKWDRLIPALWLFFILSLIALWLLNLYVWHTLS